MTNEVEKVIYELEKEIKLAQYIDNDYIDCVEVSLLQDAVKLLKQSNQWISVKDRLPKKGQYVLCVFETGYMVVACIYEKDEDVVFWRAQTDDGWECDMDSEPTHWMPLPEPPKEEKYEELD